MMDNSGLNKENLLNELEDGKSYLFQIEVTILNIINEFTKLSGLDVKLINHVEYQKNSILTLANFGEILINAQQIMGYALYICKTNVKLYEEIIKQNQDKYYSYEDMKNDIELFMFNNIGAFNLLNQARQSYGLYLSLQAGAGYQRKSQASIAAKSKNQKLRDWVILEYERVKASPPNFEGCGKNGRFIKDKFARIYSDKVKKEFAINSNEDKFVPATILRWIK